jgi:hypothetical protein
MDISVVARIFLKKDTVAVMTLSGAWETVIVSTLSNSKHSRIQQLPNFPSLK